MLDVHPARLVVWYVTGTMALAAFAIGGLEWGAIGVVSVVLTDAYVTGKGAPIHE